MVIKRRVKAFACGETTSECVSAWVRASPAERRQWVERQRSLLRADVQRRAPPLVAQAKESLQVEAGSMEHGASFLPGFVEQTRPMADEHCLKRPACRGGSQLGGVWVHPTTEMRFVRPRREVKSLLARLFWIAENGANMCIFCFSCLATSRHGDVGMAHGSWRGCCRGGAERGSKIR